MSIGSSTPFQPVSTVALQLGTSSNSIQLMGGGESILITNLSASVAYVRFGSDPTVEATIPTASGVIGDTPVLPNAHVLIRCGNLVSYCAAIVGTGNGVILFTRGDGSSI